MIEFPVAWEVIAYAVPDPLALMEEAHWCGRLFLRSHGIESLKNTESDIPIVEMVKMMQHGAGNIATAVTDQEAAMTAVPPSRVTPP